MSARADILRLSLSQKYTLRANGITWNPSGQNSDPRDIFTPQFQLVAPGPSSSFATWVDGSWDSEVPSPAGPFGATIDVGPGATGAMNPGVAGVYILWIRYFQAGFGPTDGEQVRTIILEAP